MTRRTVFGDFLDLARCQLDATPGTIRAAGGEDVQCACDSMARLAGVLARYVRDVTPPGATPSRSGTATSTGTGWDRARAEAQHALATMRAILHENDPRVRQKRPMSGPPDTLAHRLDAAALSLTAGRDLLQSHLAVAADGTRQYRTEWGLAITSPGAARAMLIELAAICRQAGAQGTQVALTPGWRGSPQARRRLATACQWAFILDAAVRTADRREPASAAHREELRGVPSSVLPTSRLPEANESIVGLCQGIRETGERLRRASWSVAQDAVWSPWSTVKSLRIVAGANTATCHHSQTVLRALAAGGTTGGHRAELLAAADAAAHARVAWLTMARALETVTTDSRGYISAEAAEARKLALWSGRLAYADAQWTLPDGPSHVHRDAAALAIDERGITAVVAAIHQAAFTTLFVANADYAQLRTAGRAGRVLAPVSTLPDTYDIPCAFTRAPDPRVNSLLSAYRDAATASSHAAAAIAEISELSGTPSWILASVAVAARLGPDPSASVRTAGLRSDGPSAEGPHERVLRDLGVTRPDLLSRARAIDQASERLLIQAGEDREPIHASKQIANLSTSAGTAAIISRTLAEREPENTMRLLPHVGGETSQISLEHT